MTGKPFSLHRGDIVKGLRELGAARGDVLEVHSSLSRLGWVEGGAETVIDALMEVVSPEGGLVMSAYPVSPAIPLTAEETARGITWKVRILADGSRERTGLGTISETFQRRPGTQLGSGLHRVCAWGKEADRLSRGYQSLLEMDGRVLLMGVGIDRCSSMHLVEEQVGIPEAIHKLTEPPEDLLRNYPPDQFSIGFGGTPEDAWSKIWERANQQGLVRKGMIGQAECALFQARAVLGIYESWLRTDPFGLYGVREEEQNPG